MVYYVFTSTPDKPGILRNLFETILSFHGNIAHFRQDIILHPDSGLPIGNVHLIANWDQESVTPSKEYLKDEILKQFIENIYHYTKVKEKDGLIVRVEERMSPTKTIARFEIDFFDRKGIASKIFEILSGQNISVLESNYKLVSKYKLYKDSNIGHIEILADFTNVSAPIDVYQEGISAIDGVFNVNFSKASGYYSL